MQAVRVNANEFGSVSSLWHPGFVQPVASVFRFPMSGYILLADYLAGGYISCGVLPLQSKVRFMTHDLRRTFLTIGESLDIPYYALKRLANHKDSNDVTSGYIKSDVERLRQPMQQITDAILGFAKVSKSGKLQRVRDKKTDSGETNQGNAEANA